MPVGGAHVEERGGTALDASEEAEACRSTKRLLIVGCLERPNPGAKPGEEAQPFGLAAEERLNEV